MESDPNLLKIKEEIKGSEIFFSPEFVPTIKKELLNEDNEKFKTSGVFIKTEIKQENESLSKDPLNHISETAAHFEVEEKDSIEGGTYITENSNNLSGKKNGPNRQKVKCLECGVICRDKSAFRFHRMDHTGERLFQCDVCKKFYKKSTDLRYHMKIHTGERNVHCEHCGKGFIVRSALRVHMRVHSKEKPYDCFICGHLFSHLSSLKSHIDTHNIEPKFECPECNRKFRTNRSLKEHKRTHEGGYKCKICSKCYRSKEGLRLHTNAHFPTVLKEIEEHDYCCEHCGMTYKHKISLRYHLRTHSDDLFTCDICSKTYKNKGHLKVHMRKHTGETPYQCNLCERKFSRRDSMAYHKTTHNEDRPIFKCDICDKDLACKSSLRVHKKVAHTEEKPFHCNMCDLSFKLRYSLRVHSRVHERAAKAATTMPVRKLDKIKTCKVCGKEFKRKGFYAHLSTHGIKIFSCNCKRQFDDEEEFKIHKKNRCRTTKFESENDVINDIPEKDGKAVKIKEEYDNEWEMDLGDEISEVLCAKNYESVEIDIKKEATVL